MPYKQYECSGSYTRMQHTLIHYIFVSGVIIIVLFYYSFCSIASKLCVHWSTFNCNDIQCWLFSIWCGVDENRPTNFFVLFNVFQFFVFLFFGSVSRANPVFLVAVKINRKGFYLIAMDFCFNFSRSVIWFVLCVANCELVNLN